MKKQYTTPEIVIVDVMAEEALLLTSIKVGEGNTDEGGWSTDRTTSESIWEED